MRILLVGNIASGKTTLAGKIGERFGVPVFKEEADKSHLFEAFSLQRQQWSFEFHMAMLNERFANHFLCRLGGGVIDRTIWETKAFGTVGYELGEMTKNEFSRFLRRFDQLESHASIPAAKVVYLESAPEKCLERVKCRGREWEKGIDLDYLHRLDAQYKQVLDSYLSRQGGVKVVNTTANSEIETVEIVTTYLEAEHVRA